MAAGSIDLLDEDAADLQFPKGELEYMLSVCK